MVKDTYFILVFLPLRKRAKNARTATKSLGNASAHLGFTETDVTNASLVLTATIRLLDAGPASVTTLEQRTLIRHVTSQQDNVCAARTSVGVSAQNATRDSSESPHARNAHVTQLE